MIVSFTGHRPDKLGKEYDYNGPYTEYFSEKIENVLRNLNPKKAISGMALGIDTLAAVNCLYLKIPLIAAIPFPGQERKWIESSQKLYRKILKHKLVTSKILSDGPYSAKLLQKRNEY